MYHERRAGTLIFFFFSLPSRILKGSSSSIREKLFTRCEFFFSRGRDIISLARIRVLLLREMCYRGNLNYYSRGSVFSSFLFRRVEGNYPRLKIFYGFHWGWWNKKWVEWISENRGIDKIGNGIRWNLTLARFFVADKVAVRTGSSLVAWTSAPSTACRALNSTRIT